MGQLHGKQIIFFLLFIKGWTFSAVHNCSGTIRGSQDTGELQLVRMIGVNTYIQLLAICFVNFFFTLCGVFFNILVILSLWKSSQLKKKLCYFMLMVLSFFDLLAVITNHPVLAIYSVTWMNEKYEMLERLFPYVDSTDIFLGFSLLALVVMNLDRYLAMAYPIFHRTSVTRKRLLIVLTAFLLFEIILTGISVNNVIISDHVATMIFAFVVSPPLFLINGKLFLITRRVAKKNAVSPERMKNSVNMKNISSCLLAVACLICLYLPMSIYITLTIKEGSESTNVKISWLWTKTIITTNSTFNCLIFFWKNKILRKEAMRVIDG